MVYIVAKPNPALMADKPKKRASFLHELKRRNVFRVIAVYAGAAFVIIELINNVVDPLSLPQWLPTIIILLLIVGFPVTAILSWIFDLTPEGMKKTGSIQESDEIQEPEKHRSYAIRKFIRRYTLQYMAGWISESFNYHTFKFRGVIRPQVSCS
jgi:hypothetical protein